MGLRTVVDTTDPELADYVRLRETSLRRSLESEHGLFIAEGATVIRRAAAAGYRPRSFLLAPRWVDSLDDVLTAHPDVPCLVAEEDLVEQVTGFHVHRGALASFHRRALPELTTVLDGARRVVVLDDLVDHTNVGAVFRSVAALGADAVLVGEGCADPLYRRSVKVSMGAVFHVPWTRVGAVARVAGPLRAAGFTVAALALADDAVPLERFVAAAPERVALVLGTEGHGLGAASLAAADTVVTIPMSGGVDSLNVAASAAVALWALRTGSP